MFLSEPPEGPAASRLYQSDLDSDGFVMNLSRLWAWRPEVCEGFTALRALLTKDSSLSRRELSVLVCASVASLGDSYCSLAWGSALAGASDAATAAAVLQASSAPALSEREIALANWARKVARNPNSTAIKDVSELRSAGLADREIFEATVFVAFRLAFSTVNDALGAQPDWQLAETAPPEVRAAVNFGRAPAVRTA
jgi:uncharacterized peroxidase-related enzyme